MVFGDWCLFWFCEINDVESGYSMWFVDVGILVFLCDINLKYCVGLWWGCVGFCWWDCVVFVVLNNYIYDFLDIFGMVVS